MRDNEAKSQSSKSRAPPIQLYKPPKARGQHEQPKPTKQIIDLISDLGALLDVEATRAKCANERQRNGDQAYRKKSCRREWDKEQTSSESAVDELVEKWVKIELKDRVSDELEVTNIAAAVEADQRDIIVLASNGKGFRANVEVLKGMSPYFYCTLRGGWQETTRRVIKTNIPEDLLDIMLNFLRTGEIKLTTANVGRLFMVAEYLQIECVIKSCCDFVSERISELNGLALSLGRNHIAMASVAEKAVDYFCENVLSLSSELFSLNLIDFTMILSKDELNVASEEQVYDLALQWMQTNKHDLDDMKIILDCVRLPHLTKESFNRLCAATEGKFDSPYIRLIKSKRFTELPDDQLARRLFYHRHLHIMWQRVDLEKHNVDSGKPRDFQINCLICDDQKMVCDEVIHRLKDFQQHRTEFEVIPIMNTLYVVTHNRNFSRLLVFQLKNGYWIKFMDFQRGSSMRDFSASAVGSKLHLSFFNGFTKPLQTIMLEPVNSREIHYVDFVFPTKVHFSPPKMIFQEDCVIYMMDETVDIFDRVKNEHVSIGLLPTTSKFPSKRFFSSIFRFEDTLFAYDEDPISCQDRLYLIDLNAKEVKSTADVHYSVSDKSLRSGPLQDQPVTRKMSIVGSRLVIGIFSPTNDKFCLMEFDPETNSVSNGAEINCAEYSQHGKFQKRLITIIPTHLHSCRYETVLQNYCKSLRQLTQVNELERLRSYL